MVSTHAHIMSHVFVQLLISVVSFAGSLGEKSWPPLQPPVIFPSVDYDYAERKPMGEEGSPRSGDSPSNGDTPTPPGGDTPNGDIPPPHRSTHSEL